MTDQPMAADDVCEHHYETRILGGRPISVAACVYCRTPDWADLDEQAAELYQWGWQEGRDGKTAREKLSAYDKPREAQDAPHAPHNGPQRPDAGAETPDGAGGRQAGAGGREALREQYAAATEAAEEHNLVHALGGDRTAKTIAHALTVHGHTLNAARTMTDAELFAVPGVAGTSLSRIRAALDGCLEPDDTDQTEHATITDPAWLRKQYAAAVQPLLMDILPKPIAAARAWEIVDTILFVRDRHLAQLRQRLELADADLSEPAPAQDGGEARTTPDNGAASEDAADNPLREQYATRAAAIRDQSALAQIRLHIAAHRPRLQYADPILLGRLEAVLRQVGELEAASGGEGA